MLVFGHTGITLGAAVLFARALGSSRFSEEETPYGFINDVGQKGPYQEKPYINVAS